MSESFLVRFKHKSVSYAKISLARTRNVSGDVYCITYCCNLVRIKQITDPVHMNITHTNSNLQMKHFTLIFLNLLPDKHHLQIAQYQPIILCNVSSTCRRQCLADALYDALAPLSLGWRGSLYPHFSVIWKRLACQMWVSSHFLFLCRRIYSFTRLEALRRCLRDGLLVAAWGFRKF